MKKLSLVISVLAALLIFDARFGFCQVLMEPSKVEIQVEPGENVFDKIRLHNNSSSAADFKVYWQDFEYEDPETGKKEFMPAGSSQYSLSEWISFSPQRITILPGGVGTIDYNIRVPKDAAGGHYGVLFLEGDTQEPTGQVSLSIITRMGILFFVDMENSDRTATVENIGVVENAISGTLTNLGDIILKPKIIHYILDAEGLVVDRGQDEGIRLPPEKSVIFSIAAPKDLSSGQYTAVMTFDLGEGVSVVKEADFMKDQQGQISIKAVRD